MGKNDNTYGGKSKKDWEDCGFKKPAVIKAWVDNGFTNPETAKDWVDNGFTDPAVAKIWADNGFKWTARIANHIGSSTAAQVAAANFKKLGFSPQEAGPWFLGLYVELNTLYTHPSDVAKRAMKWMHSGFTDPKIVCKWINVRADEPQIAREWIDNLNIDVNNPEMVNDFQAVFGYDCFSDVSKVKRWRSYTGIKDLSQLLANAKIWVEAVGSTTEALNWLAAGVTDPGKTRFWVDMCGSGYALMRMKQWRGTGADLEEIKFWIDEYGSKEALEKREEWHKVGITDIGMVRHWRSLMEDSKAFIWIRAGVTNPDMVQKYEFDRVTPDEVQCWHKNTRTTDPDPFLIRVNPNPGVNLDDLFTTKKHREVIPAIEKIFDTQNYSREDLNRALVQWYANGIKDPEDIKQWLLADVWDSEWARKLQIMGFKTG